MDGNVTLTKYEVNLLLFPSTSVLYVDFQDIDVTLTEVHLLTGTHHDESTFVHCDTFLIHVNVHVARNGHSIINLHGYHSAFRAELLTLRGNGQLTLLHSFHVNKTTEDETFVCNEHIASYTTDSQVTLQCTRSLDIDVSSLCLSRSSKATYQQTFNCNELYVLLGNIRICNEFNVTFVPSLSSDCEVYNILENTSFGLELCSGLAVTEIKTCYTVSLFQAFYLQYGLVREVTSEDDSSLRSVDVLDVEYTNIARQLVTNIDGECAFERSFIVSVHDDEVNGTVVAHASLQLREVQSHVNTFLQGRELNLEALLTLAVAVDEELLGHVHNDVALRVLVLLQHLANLVRRHNLEVELVANLIHVVGFEHLARELTVGYEPVRVLNLLGVSSVHFCCHQQRIVKVAVQTGNDRNVDDRHVRGNLTKVDVEVGALNDVSIVLSSLQSNVETVVTLLQLSLELAGELVGLVNLLVQTLLSGQTQIRNICESVLQVDSQNGAGCTQVLSFQTAVGSTCHLSEHGDVASIPHHVVAELLLRILIVLDHVVDDELNGGVLVVSCVTGIHLVSGEHSVRLFTLLDVALLEHELRRTLVESINREVAHLLVVNAHLVASYEVHLLVGLTVTVSTGRHATALQRIGFVNHLSLVGHGCLLAHREEIFVRAACQSQYSHGSSHEFD